MTIRPLAGSSDAMTIDVCSPMVTRFIPGNEYYYVPDVAVPVDDSLRMGLVLCTREKLWLR
jgi:hypothetical protein